MKKYTICSNTEGEILLVPTDDIYKVVNLEHCNDHSYIYDKKREELTPTEGYYPTDYFADNGNEVLVVKTEDIENDDELMRSLNGNKHLTIVDGWEEVDVIDITETYMAYPYGNAVDIEHGINTTTIIIDGEDDLYGWKSDEDVSIVDWYCEHEQVYPTQEYSRILICDNGKKIRETTPFDLDNDICSYEFVK